MEEAGCWRAKWGGRPRPRATPWSRLFECCQLLTNAHARNDRNNSHGDRTDGVIRVSGTRVTLDSIVLAFNEGATPEEIAQHLIGYCLRHTAEMEEYLRRRLRESQEVQRQNEVRWIPDGIRQRLLARRSNRA